MVIGHFLNRIALFRLSSQSDLTTLSFDQEISSLVNTQPANTIETILASLIIFAVLYIGSGVCANQPDT